MHLIFSQSYIDIFFIDWEKPRLRGEKQAPNQNQASDTRHDNGVSIWRTYFAVNEWNEIQSYRKTSRVFNIMGALFFLSVLGFENFGTSDPRANQYFTSDQYKAPFSPSFRFAINVSVWIVIGKIS